MQRLRKLLRKGDSRAVRAVIDHNVWITALLSPTSDSGGVLEGFIEARFLNITCIELADELAEVLCRPQLARFGITLAQAREFRRLLLLGSRIVEVPGELRVCRDCGDDIIIETACLGEADAIVSKDSDLHQDENVRFFVAARQITVMGPNTFLAELAREGSEL